MEGESANQSNCEILAAKARNAHALALRLNRKTREKLADIMPHLGYEMDGCSFYQIARAIFSYGVDALSKLTPITRKQEVKKHLKESELKPGRPVQFAKS